MQLPKSWLLVLLISVGQLLCLLLGVIWFGGWLHRRTAEVVSKQALENNQHFADQIGTMVEALELSDLEDADNIDQLQSVVQRTRLPNDGFICVIDNIKGGLIAHPDLTNSPDLEGQTPGAAILNQDGGVATILDSVKQSSDATASGWAELADGTHLISAKHLPESHAVLLVHQRSRGIDRAVQKMVNPIRGVLILVAAAISVLSIAINLSILERYDNRLSRMNDDLKKIVQRRTATLTKTRNAIIFGLAKLAESRDNDTGEHLERIRIYVTILAEHLSSSINEIDAEFISNLGLASSLHDIGKVGIPDAILLKPARLTPDERKVIEEHPVIGGDCLRAIQRKLGSDDFLEMAREIAYNHHERWDGRGYPHRLKGTNIPLAARLVALADVYDALTTKRPYKSPMTHEEAKKIIVSGKETQFDPRVVQAFLDCEDEFHEVSCGVGLRATSSDSSSLTETSKDVTTDDAVAVAAD